jgi:ABC-type spermidine/putrescine transport system permease subunit II
LADTAVRFRRVGIFVTCLLVAVMYAPLVMVFVFSFNASRIGSVWTGVSTRWYGELFRSRDLWEGLEVSLRVGVASSTISVLLGTLGAVGLRYWGPRSRRVAQGLLALPLVVPDVIIAVSLSTYFHILGLHQGVLTVVLAHVSFGVSYAFIVVSAGVADLDESLYAAALDCGATPRRAFTSVTLPILWPSLVVAWLLVFALSFDDFLITFFTKGAGSDTLPIKIYSRMRFGVRPDTNALFVVLFLVTLSCLCLAYRVGRQRHTPLG